MAQEETHSCSITKAEQLGLTGPWPQGALLDFRKRVIISPSVTLYSHKSQANADIYNAAQLRLQPVVAVYRPPTFDLHHLDEAWEFLDSEGFVIFREAITHEVQQTYIDEIHQWIPR